MLKDTNRPSSVDLALPEDTDESEPDETEPEDTDSTDKTAESKVSPVLAFDDPGPPALGIIVQSGLVNPQFYLFFLLGFLCWKPDVACSPHPGTRPTVCTSLLRSFVAVAIYAAVGSAGIYLYWSHLDKEYGYLFPDEFPFMIWVLQIFLAMFWLPFCPVPCSSPLEVFGIILSWQLECCFAWRISGRCYDPLLICGCKAAQPQIGHKKYEAQVAVQNAVNSDRIYVLVQAPGQSILGNQFANVCLFQKNKSMWLSILCGSRMNTFTALAKICGIGILFMYIVAAYMLLLKSGLVDPVEMIVNAVPSGGSDNSKDCSPDSNPFTEAACTELRNYYTHGSNTHTEPHCSQECAEIYVPFAKCAYRNDPDRLHNDPFFSLCGGTDDKYEDALDYGLGMATGYLANVALGMLPVTADGNFNYDWAIGFGAVFILKALEKITAKKVGRLILYICTPILLVTFHIVLYTHAAGSMAWTGQFPSGSSMAGSGQSPSGSSMAGSDQSPSGGMCAPGCSLYDVNNYQCDQACMVEACGFDGDDCGYNHGMTSAAAADIGADLYDHCAPNCPFEYLGDDYCDHACNVQACDLDGGDCNGDGDYGHADGDSNGDGGERCAGGATMQDNGTIDGFYGDHAECWWTLTCSDPSAIARMTFLAFDVESDYDFVYIYDGDSADAPQLGEPLHGTDVPMPIEATGSALYVQLQSDDSVVGDGFTATLTCGDAIIADGDGHIGHVAIADGDGGGCGVPCSAEAECQDGLFCNFDGHDHGACEPCLYCSTEAQLGGTPDTNWAGCMACGLPDGGIADCVASCSASPHSSLFNAMDTCNDYCDPDCPLDYIQDGYCDHACNNEDCDFDGGDCEDSGSDGDCDFDGGDCEDSGSDGVGTTAPTCPTMDQVDLLMQYCNDDLMHIDQCSPQCAMVYVPVMMECIPDQVEHDEFFALCSHATSGGAVHHGSAAQEPQSDDSEAQLRTNIEASIDYIGRPFVEVIIAYVVGYMILLGSVLTDFLLGFVLSFRPSALKWQCWGLYPPSIMTDMEIAARHWSAAIHGVVDWASIEANLNEAERTSYELETEVENPMMEVENPMME